MTRSHWLVVGLLLLGALLRVHGLGAMDGMLHHDEAYNALDALALNEYPQLRVYFTANTGREGLYYYPLAWGQLLLGESVFALRVVSVWLGLLTLAASYRLGVEVVGRKNAVWVVGALAVLYWPVQLNHLIFRVNMLPLVAALAFAALLRAARLHRGWWLAGLLSGLLLYTYVAAVALVAYAILCLLLIAWRDARARRGALLACAIILLMGVPLGLALLQPAQTTASLDRAAATDAAMVLENLSNWGNALLGSGDPNDDHNLPQRPILDWQLALLGLAGLAGFWCSVRHKGLLLWWVGLVLVALLPTILSIDTPHFLRGAGLLLPLALLFAGVGVFVRKVRYGWALPLLILCSSAITTYTDFARWLDTAELGIYIDERANTAMATLASINGEQLLIPGFIYHPVIDYRAQQQGREAIFYDWPDVENSCLLTPNQEALVLDLPIQLSAFTRRAAPYMEIETLFAQRDNDFLLHRIIPNEDLQTAWDDAATFGELMVVRAIAPTSSTVQRGDMLILHLGLRMQRPAEKAWRFFVHLQGDPTPYEGGQLWSTGDAPLCLLAMSTPIDQTTLVQTLALPIPDDLPAGAYHVAVGLYDPATNERIPLETGTDENRYYEAMTFVLDD